MIPVDGESSAATQRSCRLQRVRLGGVEQAQIAHAVGLGLCADLVQRRNLPGAVATISLPQRRCGNAVLCRSSVQQLPPATQERALSEPGG